MQLKNFEDFKLYIMGRYKSTYRNAPYFQETYSFFEELFPEPYLYLSEFNKKTILKMANMLRITTQFIPQSELGLDSSLSSTKLLIEICKQVGADTYLCGGGAASY